MATKIGATTQDAQIDAFVDRYDGGELKIYSGSQPATADTAPTGTLLVTITLPTPAFGAGSGGVATKAGTWSGVASAGAPTNAGWFRMKSSGGSFPADGTVTATGGGGQIELANISISTGQTVTINSFSATQPAQ